jgi:hypothetical protein
LTPKVPPSCALNADLSSSTVVRRDGFAAVIQANEFSGAVLSRNVLARPPLAITAYGNRAHREPARLPECALVSTDRTPPKRAVPHEYVRSIRAAFWLAAAPPLESGAVAAATTIATIPRATNATEADLE